MNIRRNHLLLQRMAASEQYFQNSGAGRCGNNLLLVLRHQLVRFQICLTICPWQLQSRLKQSLMAWLEMSATHTFNKTDVCFTSNHCHVCLLGIHKSKASPTLVGAQCGRCHKYVFGWIFASEVDLRHAKKEEEEKKESQADNPKFPRTSS